MIADRLFTQTTWGSRDGADTDNRVRMIRLPRYGSTEVDGRKSETFEYPEQLIPTEDELPAYDTHRKHQNIPLISTTIYD